MWQKDKFRFKRHGRHRLLLNKACKNQMRQLKLNRLRAILIENVNSSNIAIAIPDSDIRIRVELLKWPLQETPTVSVMIQNMDLNINGEQGLLKTVNFTTDHLETDLEPDEFHISEREGFKNTTLSQLQEYLANEWNDKT